MKLGFFCKAIPWFAPPTRLFGGPSQLSRPGLGFAELVSVDGVKMNGQSGRATRVSLYR